MCGHSDQEQQGSATWDGSAWHQDTWHEQGPLRLVRGALGWATQRMTWSEALSPRTVPEQRRREAVPLGLGRTQGLARRCLGGPGRSHQAGKTQAKAKWMVPCSQAALGRGQSQFSPRGSNLVGAPNTERMATWESSGCSHWSAEVCRKGNTPPSLGLEGKSPRLLGGGVCLLLPMDSQSEGL